MGWCCAAGVDELVADVYGVDEGPVAVEGGGEGVDFGWDGVDVEDSEEEFHGAFCGGDHVGDLVAVCAVETDDLIAGDLLQVCCHLLR